MNKQRLFLSLITCLSFSTVHAAPNMSGHVTKQISRAVSSAIAKNLFDNLIIPELKIRNASGKVKKMQISSDKRFLSLLLADGSVRVWDLELGIQRPMLSNGQVQHLSLDSKRSVIFAASNSGIQSYDILTAETDASFAVSAANIQNLVLSTDGLLLLTANNQQLSLWDTQQKQTRWQKNDFSGKLGKIALDNQQLFAAVVRQIEGMFSADEIIEIRDLQNGSVVHRLKNKGEKIVFMHFNSNNAFNVAYQNGQVISWSLQSGSKIKKIDLDETIIALDNAPNVYAAVLENGGVLIADNQGNKIALLQDSELKIENIALLKNGEKLITVMENGQLFLWDVRQKKQLLRLISTKQGWTIVDNSGRFDSSEKGMLNISWEAANQDIPLDNFSSNYYEPGLLASALNNEAYFNSRPAVIQQGITLPPQIDVKVTHVKTVGNSVELTVEVYGQGGGIDNVALYHNSKIVNSQRSVVKDKKFKQQDQERRTITMKIEPTAGKNKIKAIASNKMGIEAKSNEAFFNVSGTSRDSKLRIMSIGINQYSDNQLNLDYSVADAESISQLLSQTKVSHFKRFDKKKLYNYQATKLSILSELRQLAQGNKEDVLAIYFAGHGVAVNGEWYFLPYETRFSSDLNYFSSVGISATELSDIFQDSNIQKILLMVDSCYSGASIDSFQKLQKTQRHFSRQMSRSVGITVVTATRKDQQAAELSDLGHGLFTFVLAKGIRGDADKSPKDNQISAHELADFSTKIIPKYAKKYLGASQEPTAFTMGGDFVLFEQ